MKRVRKYHRKPVTYGIVGRLPGSYCSHMVPIPRSVFKAMLSRYATGTRQDRLSRRSGREWTTDLATSQYLYAGYAYSEVYLFAVRG